MKQCLPFFLFLLSCMACKQKPQQTLTPPPETPFTFIPFTDYFEAELKTLDSLSIPTVRIESLNGITDTLPASFAETRTFAAPFLALKPNDKDYLEQSFADQSIASVTLTYRAKNPATLPQRIDVIIEPNPTGEDKIKSVFTDAHTQSGDTSIHTKHYWRSGKNFQQITLKEVGSQTVSTHIRKLEWMPGL